jgi:preprotein translocase subunit SecA
VIDSEDPRHLIYEVIDEAVPAKVKELVDDNEPNYAALLHWVNTTFPLGLTKEKAAFESRSVDENATFLIARIKESYERKSSHEEASAVKSLERYIILNAIDRLWQEHLYAMDALREGVYLRSYAQKDPLIEYKTEAYDMFVELMANIKNEVLNNLFRSTSNLQAFENFLATLPQFLLREQEPAPGGNIPTHRRSVATNLAPAAAEKNIRTAAAASRNGALGQGLTAAASRRVVLGRSPALCR